MSNINISNTTEIKNHNKYFFLKTNPVQNQFIKIYCYLQFCLILTFFIFLNKSYEQTEIKLIIQGGGELNFLNGQFYKDPSEVLLKGSKVNPNGKKYSFDEGLNNITIKFDDLIDSCENMFKELKNIIEIDLSNLDTSKVTNMANMFSQCENLEKITFGNINTSLVKNMGVLFYACYKLESLDLSNFDTSSVTNMHAMFSGCYIITSLNLSTFNTKNVENMHDMFGFCHNLVSVNVLSFDTSKVKNMQGMFNRNYELKYLDLSSFNTSLVTNMNYLFEESKSLLYLNLYSFIINQGTRTGQILSSTPSNLKICINDLNIRNKLSSYRKTFDCSEVCLNKNLKIDSQYKRCVQNCNESNYKYEFNNTCYNECPNGTYTINNANLCYNIKTEGFYLDLDDLKYKKCYDSCKNCYGFGNETNNNCIECKSNYILLNGSIYSFLYELNINNNKNCYIKCPYYFYFNKKTNTYYCTLNSTCPEEFNKLIYEKYECVNKCEEDNYYRYEFKRRCYEKCPENSTKIDNNVIINEYFCKPICSKEKPFEFIFTQECVKNCPIKDMKLNNCIQNYKNEKEEEENNEDNQKENEEETKAQDIMLHNIEIGFTSEEYDTSSLDKGEDEVFEDEKMTVTLTTTQNQKDSTNNKTNNMTMIDLGECEGLLRKEYKIPDNELLYMKKIDVIQEGMKIPKVEYDVYSKLSGNKLEKLNLTVCVNSKISLSIPVKITESIDKLNSSSGYYNDLCYIASSDSGTDISLKDRKKEFIEGNKTVCQDGCDFSEYDFNKNKAKCKCKVKETSTSSFADIKINKTKLYENFIDIKNIVNIKLMACYKELFNNKGIKRNIAFFVVIPLIIFHIITIILFYNKQKNIIDDKINDIAFSINNWELVKADERKQRKKKKVEKLIQKRNKKIAKNININNIVQQDKEKQEKKEEDKEEPELKEEDKKEQEIKEEDKKEQEIKEIKLLNPIDYYFLNEVLNKKHYPPKKNRGKLQLKINNNTNHNNNVLFLTNSDNNQNSNKNILHKETDEQEIIKKAKEIMEYNEEEKNNLEYKSALKYDKRTYIQFYLSLLKTKHIFIFSFFYNEDYNSKIIKIDLFFINFAIYYAVNAFFFNDNTMHKIYEDEGSFNFIYQLPQIIYSSLISAVLNVLLKLLALSEGNIIEYKKNKKKDELDKRTIDLKNKLNMKFFLYFITSFLFLLLFWYYLSMFCAIYRNTQYHLIKDTLISFGLSLIYPFGIYLLPVIFRIPALSNKKNKRECLYKMSLTFQML